MVVAWLILRDREDVWVGRGEVAHTVYGGVDCIDIFLISFAEFRYACHAAISVVLVRRWHGERVVVRLSLMSCATLVP